MYRCMHVRMHASMSVCVYAFRCVHVHVIVCMSWRLFVRLWGSVGIGGCTDERA